MASEPATLAHTRLTSTDVDACLRLSDATGWNQTADDWEVFFARGRVWGCRHGATAVGEASKTGHPGEVVATAALLAYGDLGWISMVLVAQAWRQRGLASGLLQACVAQLQELKITPVLDATPAGAEVYRRLGFAAGFTLERWDADLGIAAATASASASDRSSGAAPPGRYRVAGVADVAALIALDRQANGLDRGFLLESFLARGRSRAWLTEDGLGFVLLRRGRRAWQVGPLVARDEAQALGLLQTALAAASGLVFLDLPTGRQHLADWLTTRGFRQQRSFVRMAFGPAPIAAVNPHLFVIAGPEFG